MKRSMALAKAKGVERSPNLSLPGTCTAVGVCRDLAGDYVIYEKRPERPTIMSPPDYGRLPQRPSL